MWKLNPQNGTTSCTLSSPASSLSDFHCPLHCMTNCSPCPWAAWPLLQLCTAYCDGDLAHGGGHSKWEMFARPEHGRRAQPALGSACSGTVAWQCFPALLQKHLATGRGKILSITFGPSLAYPQPEHRAATHPTPPLFPISWDPSALLAWNPVTPISCSLALLSSLL